MDDRRRDEAEGVKRSRRPYRAPAFDSAIAFERVSLGCGEPLNTPEANSNPFLPDCALSSS